MLPISGRNHAQPGMNFELLQLRLIAYVHDCVQSGEVTERGLARVTGISQSHLHNMLKGVRVLSPPMADLILRHLQITVVDLLNADDWAGRNAGRAEEAASAWPLAFRDRTAYSGWKAESFRPGLQTEPPAIVQGPTEEAGGSHRSTRGKR